MEIWLFRFSRMLPCGFILCVNLCGLLLAGTACRCAALDWQELESGLQFTSVAPSQEEESPASIDIVRIDPALFRFSLHSASQDGGMPHSILDWAEQEELVLAINASMYLPDHVTSTGYLRYGSHSNNPRIHSKFGAFFVAEPDHADLPQAAILDRERDSWEEKLPHYTLVAQNYRLIDTDGKVLWLPGGPANSIAAIGQDREGHILFIHCRTPMSGEAFAAALLERPLALRSLMYVEGGSQAAMLVRCAKLSRLWLGQSSASFLRPLENSLTLPNILGVRRRGE